MNRGCAHREDGAYHKHAAPVDDELLLRPNHKVFI